MGCHNPSDTVELRFGGGLAIRFAVLPDLKPVLEQTKMPTQADTLLYSLASAYFVTGLPVVGWPTLYSVIRWFLTFEQNL